MAEVKLPHMPLWVYDIDTDRDCRKMTDAEFGRYMRLMIRQWIEGSVPAIPTEAIKDAGLDSDATESVQSLLDRKFSDRSGNERRNPRCASERKQAVDKVLQLRMNGQRGGEATARANAPPNARPNGHIRASGSVSGSRRKKPTTDTTHVPRARDVIFETVRDVFYGGRVINETRGEANKITEAFKELGATPEEILFAYRQHKARMPDVKVFTGFSVVKHWGTLKPQRKPALAHPAPSQPTKPEEPPVTEDEAKALLRRKEVA